MKKIYFYIFIFFVGIIHSQTIQSIDSTNNIPFEIKLEKASSLAVVFLKNAENAQKLNYQFGLAESYSNLSLIYYYQGKYNNELFYAIKAILIYEKNNFKEKLSFQYGELGYRIKKRNIEKGQFYMQKGLKIAEKNNFEKPLLSIYNNYGVLKEIQNQLDSALFFYEKGLKLKEKIKDNIGIPYSLNNIAGVYLLKKEFKKANDLYSQALKIRTDLKDQIGISENLAYFGDLYFAQKNYNRAIAYYEKSNENGLKYNYNDLIQYNYKKLSECYELTSNTSLALFNYKKFVEYQELILNKDTNAKIAELEVKYETNEKEKLLIQKESEAKQKNMFIIGISALTLLISLIGFMIYRQQKLKNQQQKQEFKLKNAIDKIETQNKLQEQRLSISRDLHDNIGAQLTFIISSVDNIKYAFDIKNINLDYKLQSISDFTKSTIVELRDTIWAMNNNEITFEDLRVRILNFLEKAKNAKEDIDFVFNIDELLNNLKLTSVSGMNIYRTIQEAVNNAIKYANANTIRIEVAKKDNIIITVQDNGVGFNLQAIEKGNGLLNMQKRIEDIDGIFKIESSNKGTNIEIMLNNKITK